jgi:transposase-like protein
MNTKKHLISADVKKQILERVKRGGFPITQITAEHGISPHTIYGWLSTNATASPSWLEGAKLRKEHAARKELMGTLAYEKTVAQNKKLSTTTGLSKSGFARDLCMSRSILYYRHKLPEKVFRLFPLQHAGRILLSRPKPLRSSTFSLEAA